MPQLDTRTALADLFNGIQQAGQSIAIEEAKTATEALKAQKLGLNEQRRGLAQIAQRLVLDLSSQGANAAQIQEIRQGLMAGVPPQPQSIDQLWMQSVAAGDQEGIAQAKEFKKFESGLKAEQAAAGRMMIQAPKTSADVMKQLNREMQKYAPGTASSRSAIGQLMSNVVADPRAEAILKSPTTEIKNAQGEVVGYDYNKLTNQQVNELIATFSRQMIGGVPALATMEELKPGTVSARVAQAFQRVRNKPVGAQAGEFVKQFAQSIERERDLSSNMLTSLRRQRLQELVPTLTSQASDQKTLNTIRTAAAKFGASGLESTQLAPNQLGVYELTYGDKLQSQLPNVLQPSSIAPSQSVPVGVIPIRK